MSAAMELQLAAKTRMPSVDFRRLPAISKQMSASVELPALYVAAKTALQECCQLDEVKDVQDKHAAIAVYARQIKDESLMYYAERIKLRAVERLGELLSEIPDAKDRKNAAEKAGVSSSLANDARAIVKLSAKTRSALIDKQSPPHSVSSLAWIARKQTRGAGGGFECYAARENRYRMSIQHLADGLVSGLSDMTSVLEEYKLYQSDFQQVLTIGLLVRHVRAADIEQARENISLIMSALDEIDQRLAARQSDTTGAQS